MKGVKELCWKWQNFGAIKSNKWSCHSICSKKTLSVIEDTSKFHPTQNIKVGYSSYILSFNTKTIM
jgi:hypothetical protein